MSFASSDTVGKLNGRTQGNVIEDGVVEEPGELSLEMLNSNGVESFFDVFGMVDEVCRNDTTD